MPWSPAPSGARDSDRDPAEQPNRVLHLCKHAQHTAGAITGHGFRKFLADMSSLALVVRGRDHPDHNGFRRQDLHSEGRVTGSLLGYGPLAVKVFVELVELRA